MGVRSFATYLWTHVVMKLGPYWWGGAIVAGIVAYALYSRFFRASGEGRGKAVASGALVTYAFVVVAVTVLSRTPKMTTGQNLNLLVAGGVTNLLRGGRMGPDTLANALMLLPMGVLLPAVFGWRLKRTTLACLTFSVWIEAVQLVCCIGYPELYDVFLNTVGAMVGYGIWALGATHDDSL